MIKNRYFIAAISIAAALTVYYILTDSDKDSYFVEEVKAERGTIRTVISSVGTIQPQNRLEIKPPLAGRIDKLLVREGDAVKAGSIIGWMSSSERAALIDAARAGGEQAVKYWNEAYKPIPIVAPITGTVIVRPVEPGQTVTAANPVLVLSDRLIVKADIDETDIGRVKVGQRTVITLDAYPEIKVLSSVSHISYESEIINNVTIYKVDIVPDSVPGVFRSGMSANVDIIESMKENALKVPGRALQSESDGSRYLFVKTPDSQKIGEMRAVKTGAADNDYVEIIEGIEEDDVMLIRSKRLDRFDTPSGGSNPFRPNVRRRN